jgi:small subunit ribosomal protein S10
MTTKMRVRVRSFDHKILEEALKRLVQVVVKAGGKVTGPIPLKTKVKKFTLLKSTFVFSKHRYTIEARTHKRLVDITEINNDVVNALATLSLPAGVDISIETITA